jgi:hypothetical protein
MPVGAIPLVRRWKVTVSAQADETFTTPLSFQVQVVVGLGVTGHVPHPLPQPVFRKKNMRYFSVMCVWAMAMGLVTIVAG